MSRLILLIVLLPTLLFAAGASLEYKSYKFEDGNIVIGYEIGGFASPGSRTIVDDDGLVSILILQSIIADNAKGKHGRDVETGNLNVDEWPTVRGAYKVSLTRLKKFYQDQIAEVRGMTNISEAQKTEYLQSSAARISELDALMPLMNSPKLTFAEFNKLGQFFNTTARSHHYMVKGTNNGDRTLPVMEALFVGRGFTFPDTFGARCWDSAKGDVQALTMQLVAALNRTPAAAGAGIRSQGGQ